MITLSVVRMLAAVGRALPEMAVDQAATWLVGSAGHYSFAD